MVSSVDATRSLHGTSVQCVQPLPASVILSNAEVQKKKIGCSNHWVVTLVAGHQGYEKFILVLEVNCISKLIPNIIWDY